VAALPSRFSHFWRQLRCWAPCADVSDRVGGRLPDAQDEVDAAVAAGLLTEGASALELAFTHPLYRRRSTPISVGEPAGTARPGG